MVEVRLGEVGVTCPTTKLIAAPGLIINCMEIEDDLGCILGEVDLDFELMTKSLQRDGSHDRTGSHARRR